MRKSKHSIALNERERRNVIDRLNNLRNKLIADGRYTNAVDGLKRTQAMNGIRSRAAEVVYNELIYN